MATDQNGGSAGSKTWRGRAEKTSERPRYRWQMTAEELKESARTSEDDSKRTRLVMLSICGLALLVLFLIWILLSPARTPLLIITESVYPASFPPNRFAEEDADRLEWLDEKNLSVYRENSLANLDQALSQIESEIFRNRVLMVYLSAHGGVNSTGQPCLIPAGASPLDSRTWLPLSQILETIAMRKFSQSTKIVLFLDCQKVLFEPRLGVLHNQFVSKIKQLQLETQQQDDGKTRIPRLAIVCSTSPGEESQTFNNQRRTIFAETLFSALSGKADLQTEGGNSDGDVSLDECYRYLQKHVAALARSNRDRPQTPTSVTTEALSQSRSPRLTLALRDKVPPSVALEPGPSTQWQETIAKLWHQFERLTPRDYLETHPDETARLQQLLLRLESWSAAGNAYQPHAISLATLLQEHLNQLESHAQNSKTFLRSNQMNLMPDDVPGLRLSQSLSPGYDDQLQELEASLQTCLLNTNRDSFQSARNQWISSARLQLTPEFHWIDLLLREGSENLWKDSQRLQALLETELAARHSPALKHLRVFQLLVPELERADAARRTAEDFIATENMRNLSELQQQTESAIEGYSQLELNLDQRRQAFQLCNEIAAHLPWMWELLVRIFNDDLQEDSLGQALSSQRLQKLHRESEQLRRLLDSGEFDTPQYEALSDQFVKLQSNLSKYFGTVEAPEEMTLSSVARISRCLESPLISSDNRKQLWKARSSLLQEIRNRKSRSPVEQNSKRARDSATLSSEHLALLQTGVSPLFVSAVPQEDQSGEQPVDLEDLSVTGLQTFLREELLHRYRVAKQLLDPDDETEYTRLLTNLEQHEYQGRQVAAWNLAQYDPMSDEMPESRNRASQVLLLEVASVSQTYWRSQMQKLLLLDADRAIEDMWGMNSISGTPYFQAVTEQLLDTAEGIMPAHGETASHISSRRKLLLSRLDLMQNKIRIESDEVVIVDPDLPSESRLRLRIPPINPDVPPDFSWPSGKVTLTLENSSGRCSLNSTLADWEKFSAFGASYELPERLVFDSPSYFQDEQQLWARFFWRGHEFRTRVPFVNINGGRTETVEKEPQPTTLNVLAEIPQPTNLLFVLDVSQSMNENTSDQSGRSRWEVALGVLNQALAPLMDQSHLRVGVIAYGHRAGWNPQNPDALLYQPSLKDSTPPGLLPLEDVEILLAPGPLTPQTMEQLRSKMTQLTPWGETPLYLAINEAVKLVPDKSSTPTQIIVLTDGVNRQRIPQDLILTESQQAKLISADQLQSALGARSIELNVLGFELSAERDAELHLELRNVINRAGGAYYPAVEAGNLLPLIQGIVGPREYEVSRSFNLMGTYPLGQQSDVERSSTDRRSVDVSVRTASTQITNDERRSIQLYYRSDRAELTPKPFLNDLSQKIPITTASAAPRSGLWLGVHYPRFASAEERDVRLAFSLQSDSGQFVPRPEVFMIHATAVNAEGEALGREWFYLKPELRADFTVPLWQLNAKSWPREASHILLEAYISWNPANFESEIWPLSDVISETVPPQSTNRLYVARTESDALSRIFLYEKREDAGQSWPGFFRLRAENDANRTPAWSIRHVFDEAHGIHLQTFTPLTQQAELPETWNVEVIRPNPPEMQRVQRIETEPLPVLSSGEFLRVLP